MTPRDLENHPQLWYESSLLASIGLQADAFARMQGTSCYPEWLDCYDLTKQWLRFLNQQSDTIIRKIQRQRIGKPRWDPIEMIAKPIGTDVTRKGEPPPKPGLHVAVRVQLTTKTLILDQTHSQFDLGADLHRDKVNALASHPQMVRTIRCFIVEATTESLCSIKWESFLISKSHEVARADGVRVLAYSELL